MEGKDIHTDATQRYFFSHSHLFVEVKKAEILSCRSDVGNSLAFPVSFSLLGRTSQTKAFRLPGACGRNRLGACSLVLIVLGMSASPLCAVQYFFLIPAPPSSLFSGPKTPISPLPPARSLFFSKPQSFPNPLFSLTLSPLEKMMQEGLPWQQVGAVKVRSQQKTGT